MASTIAAQPGSPYSRVALLPAYGTEGFVENVGFGVKVFVTAYLAMVKFYGRYRVNIVKACQALNTVPPVTVPPLGDKIIAALDAVFAFAPDIAKLDAPGAG